VIVPRFRFHWLRHTAISHMARAGMKPELIAERVGHTDGGALIYRRYRHLFPSELRAAVSLVDELVATRVASGGQEMVSADACADAGRTVERREGVGAPGIEAWTRVPARPGTGRHLQEKFPRSRSFGRGRPALGGRDRQSRNRDRRSMLHQCCTRNPLNA
jgi:hypothetical protein